MDCIWCEIPKERLNETLSFRFMAKKDYGKIEMAISATSTFRIFLNGEFILGGPSRTGRGYSVVHRQEIFLRAGDVLCADVCNYRINAFFPVKEEGFFACELRTQTGKLVATSEDFSAYRLIDRIEKTERLSFQRSFTEGYDMTVCRSRHYLGEEVFPLLPTIKVKGNILTERKRRPSHWERKSARQVLERGTITYSDEETPLKKFVFDRIDDTVQGYKKEELQLRINERLLQMRYKKGEFSLEGLRENEYLLYEFDRNLTGYIQTKIRVEEDSELFLSFDELLWKEAYDDPAFEDLKQGGTLPMLFNRMHICQAVYFRLKKGEYSLTTSELYTLKYLKISLTKGRIRVLENPQMILCQNEDAYRMSFSVADEKLQTVFDAGVHTLAQNTQDIPTDCPGRERAGWLCDSFFISRAEKFFCGDNFCEENFFSCFLTEEKYPFIPEGMFPMCYPADHNDGTFIPNWSMWLVLEVRDHAKRTGSTAYLQAFKEKFYKMLRYFEKYENQDGLLENLDGWVFVEWSKCNDFIQGINYPTNMLYWATLRAMGEAYADENLLSSADRLREKILQYSFDGMLFREHSATRAGGRVDFTDFTETCQYYAFFLGLATEREFLPTYRLAFEKTTPTGEELRLKDGVLHKANTFIGNFLRFSYFAETERYNKLLEEITDYFYPMALRTGTLWESKFSTGSCNHGFTAVVAEWIVKAVTGFRDYDKNEGCVYLAKTRVERDFCLEIPTEKGEIRLFQTDGKYGVECPAQFTIKYV